MPVLGKEMNDKAWRKTISKAVLAVVLWAVAPTRVFVYGNQSDTRETLVSAFQTVRLDEMTASAEAFGYYGDVYLSEKAKETFVKDIGYKLGLNFCEPYTNRDGSVSTTGILKVGKYATTRIELVTREEKITDNILESHQYLIIKINFGENLDACVQYQSILKELYQEMDIESDVTVNLTGELDGKADLAFRNMIADQIISQMKGRIVAENRTDSLYTIYAYTDKVDDYIKVSGKKINLNISASYDEQRDKTCFYVATPIINNDY